MHLQDGAILEHFRKEHQQETTVQRQGRTRRQTIRVFPTLTRDILVENTKILHKINDKYRLSIVEALIINKDKPIFNRQNTGTQKTLYLFRNC